MKFGKKNFISFFFLFSLIALGSALQAQQQGIAPQKRQRLNLGWNSQGRGQYEAQIRQNKTVLQQRQQSDWGQSPTDGSQQGTSSQQSLGQRHRLNYGWNSQGRGQYESQIQQNKTALQQRQQSDWGQSPTDGNQQGTSSQQSLGQRHRLNYGWNSQGRGQYEAQVQQNQIALQQQQQARSQQKQQAAQ